MIYKYWFAVSRGGNVLKRRLLDIFQSARNIYETSDGEIKAAGVMPERACREFLLARSKWQLKEAYDQFVRQQVSLVTLEDAAYPAYLKEVSDAPYGLFYRGMLPESNVPTVAMVGARRPSGYGEKFTTELAGMLAQNGYDVVSGMALGIDGIAHRGALEAGGRTYAFLGCGADICYPRRHRPLYDAIIQSGAILSEYPPQTAPIARNFPARNRLISGMSEAVIVMEARAKSGSLITADFALEQGRDVYALPGRISDPLSEGTNRLIAQGASMICSKEGLLADLSGDIVMGEGVNTFTLARQIKLEKEELLVYSCFDFYAKSIETVAEETGLELSVLLSVLIRLCGYGLIRETFKNHYARM